MTGERRSGPNASPADETAFVAGFDRGHHNACMGVPFATTHATQAFRDWRLAHPAGASPEADVRPDEECAECDGTGIVDGIGAGSAVVDVKCLACEPPSEDVLRIVHAFDDEERKALVRDLAARVKATETAIAALRRESAGAGPIASATRDERTCGRCPTTSDDTTHNEVTNATEDSSERDEEERHRRGGLPGDRVESSREPAGVRAVGVANEGGGGGPRSEPDGADPGGERDRVVTLGAAGSRDPAAPSSSPADRIEAILEEVRVKQREGSAAAWRIVVEKTRRETIEKCAKECEAVVAEDGGVDGINSAALDCAARIRALPCMSVPEEKKT